MPSTLAQAISIYTDGSCHTKHLIGAWVAILFIAGEKIVLSGNVINTTNNRMELTAVIEAIKYIHNNHPGNTAVQVYTDSQYVINLPARSRKLAANNFLTHKRKEIQNAELVKEFLALITNTSIQFLKIKAHQKQLDEPNYNIEADKLSRKMVREAVLQLT